MPDPIPTTAPKLFCFAVEEEARSFRPKTKSPILVTGIGRANALRSLVNTLDNTTPSVVFTCGFAGGLNPKLPTGTVLHSSSVEFGLTEAGSREGVFYCGDRVLVTPAEKNRCHDQTGADAVEMESGAIHEFCEKSGIPCATVRVISDAANEALPLDFNNLMNENMTLRNSTLAVAILRRPWRIPALIRFSRQVKSAADNLTSVLTRVDQSNP